MTKPQRVTTPTAQKEEERPERALRPTRLKEFIGQRKLCDNLTVFIAAAKTREVPLDHVLLCGAPGLGKTTLAYLIANEMGADITITSGPAIGRAGELAALLTNLKKNDILFIDEIHRLPVPVEEVLYQALEDYKLDIMVGEGPSARSVRLNLAPFTLIGATTRSGLLSRPLRDRFGILEQLNFYAPAELATILKHAAQKLGAPLSPEGSETLALRARGTPRIGLRLLRRLFDFATVEKRAAIDTPLVQQGLLALGVDQGGLDALDRRYLSLLATHFCGGPVGIETLAAALFEERRTLEDVVEPYLMQEGFLKRTPQGRVLSLKSYAHLGLEPTEDKRATLSGEPPDADA